jgi:hypothetical protein
LNEGSLEAILEQRRPSTIESVNRVNITRIVTQAPGFAIGGWAGAVILQFNQVSGVILHWLQIPISQGDTNAETLSSE